MFHWRRGQRSAELLDGTLTLVQKYNKEKESLVWFSEEASGQVVT